MLVNCFDSIRPIKFWGLCLLLMTTWVRADVNHPVQASPALLKLLSVSTLQPTVIDATLHLPARVELDQLHVARIGATVTGRITEISAVLGQTVKKGERLALLNSTELSQAQSDYLKAGSQVNLRKITVKRAERLHESGILAEAELQERQTVLNEADLLRLDRQRTIFSFSPVTASIDGVVIESHIALGQVVQPADALYTVADLSQLWMVAEAPEQQAQWARQGDQASAEVPALPGVEVSGKLIYVADLVNPETRTVTVRMALANPQRLFKPEMLATLKISKPGAPVLSVPNQAVIRENEQDYVFVEVDKGVFNLRPVSLGSEIGERRVVLNGLHAGESIVVEGAFHLNNERLRDSGN